MNGSELYLNHSMIETIEESPDTLVTLSNGNRYIVLEPACIIIEQILRIQALIMRRASGAFSARYLLRRRTALYRPHCKIDQGS